MKYLFLFLCSIPWAFLGLYGDIGWNTAWLYLAAIAVPVLLGWRSGKQGQVILGLAGNLLSISFSFALTLLLRTDRWNTYFKPFGALGMVVILWLVALVIQALIWRRYRKDTFTAALLGTSAILLLSWQLLCQLLALI